MKATYGLLATTLCCLFFLDSLKAQVSSVNYQMKFDTATCLYDCYLIINSGSATTVSQRIQFNAQYSVVVPFGTTVSVDTTYMPLINNASYTGTTPQDWDINTTWDYPAGSPTMTFLSIVPKIIPQAHYNNITSGDTIKLFSLDISPTTNCASDIRIFENGVDPSSADPDMAGLDFSNGFTVGGATQLYNANSTQVYPPKPLVVDIYNECNGGIEIDLTASTSLCQEPLTYAWTGPNSFTSTDEDVSINPSTPLNTGLYEVVITDAYGCTDSVTINATSKPDAGADQTLCAGTIDTLSGTNPATGTWAEHSGNPVGASIVQLGGGEAQITFSNSASGTYNMVYVTPACNDTMTYTINPLPVVAITGDNILCVEETSTLSPTTGGTWVSSNTSVATVTNAGVVTAVGSGTASFTFTNTLTGCENTVGPITVDPAPTVTNTGLDTICIGNTTTLTPMTGGTWASDAPGVASITNSGLVTGISEGTAAMNFTETSTGCVSDTIYINVRPKPVANITGNDSICILSTTTLTPATGGTWSSSNPLVAQVNNSGLVTGLDTGVVIFTFTDAATQCVSDPSDTVTVVGQPDVSITGDDRLCIGATSTLSPTTGGTWTSSNTSVATVTNAGVVTAVAQGSAVFTYTETASGCFNTTDAIIVDPKPTVSVSQSNICIGATTTLNPSAGGTWTAHTPAIASLSGGNTVTGVSEGTATFTFIEAGTSCESDTVYVVVEPGPVVSITGDDEICVGFTTQLSPNTGGTWVSSDPNIATVNNFGLVTGVAAGVVTFTFTDASTFCTSAPTDPITVLPRPIVSLVTTDLCVGDNTAASPSSGGTWTSSNISVATITNDGTITGVSPGFVTFTFTNSTTTCVSQATDPLTVSEIPTTSFNGPNTICVDQTTNVSPATGGTWKSSNESVATITNSGVVTGVAAGTAELTWTSTTTNCTSTPLIVTINPKPAVSVTGDSPICIGETSSLSPTTGGAWSSSDDNIAEVTNAGVVTGVNQGTATFIFISDAGCPSDASAPIIVNAGPTITITGGDELCIGDTTYLEPTNGDWVSSDGAIASVLTGGVVVALAEGTATFSFTDTITGCASDANTDPVTVNPTPTTNITGPTSICVGATSTISPTIGGSWISTDPSVATVSNAGIITGVSDGTTRFIFTNSATGCVSDTSAAIAVTPGPTVSIVGDDEICEGETTTLSPTSGGTWTSSNTLVATVTDAGVVTGVGAGNATFTFTEDGSGCQSEATDPIIVHGKPTVSVDGSTTICLGGTTNLLPNTGGTWVSSAPAVASVTSGGLVTGLTEGSATFTFTLTSTGCPSDATEPVFVSPAPTVAISGPTSICTGGQTTLTPNSGGTWTSSNPSVAIVSNGGIVTGIAPGKATFSFVETATGCSSESSTGELTISNCSNPDINSTFVDVPVDGDVNTNDMVAGTTTYGPNPVLTSSPVGSVATINLNSDGTYTFQANMVGVYTYNVPYCTPPQNSGCPTSLLTISVVDYLEPDLRPVANTDIAVTEKDSSVTLISLENDRCVVVTGCNLDPTSVTIEVDPDNGTATADALTGDITYTPGVGFLGKDTLTYQVCVSGEPTNCAQAIQIISIYDPTADNTTDAADDYAVTAELTPVSGNVASNDTDMEGDNQAVTAQNVTVAAGTLDLAANGDYTFTPAEEFFGPVEFPYETCDDNDSVRCANATLHILVVPDLSVKIRVYLEGSLMNNLNAKGTTHNRPLMKDNLRSSPFNGNNYIPTQDPYQVDVIDEGFGAGNYNTGMSTIYAHVLPGTMTEFMTIPDPSTVFAKTGEDAITDWVFVELRSKSDSTSIVATRSGLVQRDADVADLNGTRGLRFPGIPMDDYYVVVKHRNHLGAMTSNAQTPKQLTELVDFTDPAVPLFDRGVVDYGGGVMYDFTGLAVKNNANSTYRALWAGDFDGNNKIKASNPGDDLNVVFFDVFSHPNNTSLKANFDFAYGYRNADFDMNAKVKFDNPNDDKNMLFGQLLFYPLNTSFLSNFDFFIEQLPE